MSYRLVLAIWLLATPLWAAPPTLKLPEKVVGKPGQFIEVPAETAGKFVSWYSLDSGLNLFPTELLKDTHTAVVVASAPGNYRLLAVTAAADEVSPLVVCTILIEGPAPPPVPPVPPGPIDPFAQVLQAAFATDPDTQKATRIKDLAALYRQASQTTVNDTSLKTTADLLAVLQKARSVLMPDTAITSVRQLVATELNKTLSATATLDVAKRAELTATFSRIAAALEAVR